MKTHLWLGLSALFLCLAPEPDPATAQVQEKKGTFKLTTAEVKSVERVYKTTPQGDLLLHFYLPPDWKASDRRPVIVFFFGGGWRNGSYTQFVPQAEYFASRGLVAASADYRIESKHKTTPDKCVEDAKSAIRWLRANAGKLGIDPDKVIASGGSAGGHLAACTAVLDGFDAKDDDLKVSCKPNALVLFNPALDVKGRLVLDGDGKDISKVFWPNSFLKKGAPPAVIFFGTSDRLLEGGRDFLAKSKELGNRAELYTAAEMPHGFFNRPPWLQVTTKKADEFLASLGYLAGAPTVQLPADAKELKKEEPGAKGAGEPRPPNVVLFFTDDQGYGDVGCFGANDIRTPHLDRMAREGMRFTNFCVAQAVCTASRAALLTGCYSNRVSLFGALNHTSTNGISDDEVLLPELCKQRGYATAVYGKWHLGHHSKFNPLRHGFDDYLGIPYPNDTSKYHPVIRDLPPLPLIEGEKVIASEPDQSQFTRMFTERAVRFIEKNKDRPFFLYVPQVMPHVPIFASEKFRGKSQRGLYGDVIEELDWSAGEVLGALRKHGLDERTLVIFTSDNGPFLSYGSHAGSAGPLRGGKLTAFEGGVRMPCIMRWPGKVPAGKTCDELVSAMDILPTVAGLIGAKLPAHPIDGKDILPLLTGQPGAKSPHEAFYYYAGEQLQAVRSGDWKLHFPHPYLEVAGEPGRDGKPANFANLKPESIKLSGLEGIASRHGYKIEQIGLTLYNLKDDVGETKNVADQHPDVVRRLQALAEKARAELGDSLTGRKGTGVRPAGKL